MVFHENSSKWLSTHVIGLQNRLHLTKQLELTFILSPSANLCLNDSILCFIRFSVGKVWFHIDCLQFDIYFDLRTFCEKFWKNLILDLLKKGSDKKDSIILTIIFDRNQTPESSGVGEWETSGTSTIVILIILKQNLSWQPAPVFILL